MLRSFSVKLTQVPSTERVRLPWAGLSEAEHSGVVAPEQGLNQGLDAGVVHLILGGRGPERMVEGEDSVGADHNLSAVRYYPHTYLVVLDDFTGKQWPDTQRHLDTHLGHDAEVKARGEKTVKKGSK